jgi:hypothetical protein
VSEITPRTIPWVEAEAGDDGWVVVSHSHHQMPVFLRAPNTVVVSEGASMPRAPEGEDDWVAYLGGAVDREASDARVRGGVYEGGGYVCDAGVLQMAARVEEAHGGGGASWCLGHRRR